MKFKQHYFFLFFIYLNLNIFPLIFKKAIEFPSVAKNHVVVVKNIDILKNINNPYKYIYSKHLYNMRRKCIAKGGRYFPTNLLKLISIRFIWSMI